jgi:cytochrome c oxidase subunit 2
MPGPVHILPGLVGRQPYKTRRLAGAVAVALLAMLVLAPAASAGWFLPESDGSPNADAIRTLYILIAILALIIFLGVEGLLIYSLLKFRARKGRVAAQIHGNTQLEIGWTVGAFVLLIFITVFTFILLDDIKNPAASDIDENGNPVAANVQYAQTNRPGPPPGSASMNITVFGEQYVWSYEYPGEERVLAYTDMYVPVGMTITLDIEAKDVVHSWWIPELGGKADAVPGLTNKSWFKIPLDAIPEGEDRVVYEGQCAELCGRNHADMLGRVIGLRYDDWRAWYDRKVEEIQTARDEAAQRREELEQAEGQPESGGEAQSEDEGR